MPRQTEKAVHRYPETRSDAPEKKPIKLRSILAHYGIKQTEWCNSIVQQGGQGSGRGLSQPAGTNILKHNTWPRLTSPECIMLQTETFLKDSGVSKEDIAIAWDYDDGSTDNVSFSPAFRSKMSRQKINDAIEFQLPENQMLSQKAKKHFKFTKSYQLVFIKYVL